MASSSSSRKYHVFLSFSGEDTRQTFVDHLFNDLKRAGINTYKDDITLRRGEPIKQSLLTAIEESWIAVVILSKNYADSSWCLDELVHIMKCKVTKDQIVIPIFYDVDPSEEVRKQKRKYGEAFLKHEFEVDNKAKVESWRKALVDIGNISGWVPTQIFKGYEAKFTEEIVEDISQKLFPTTSSVDDNLVGIEVHMKDLRSMLQIGLGGKRMIGIWGVGGIGKTTLAFSIYSKFSGRFNGSCFLKDIRKKLVENNSLENLQEEIISSVLNKKQVGVARVENMITNRLCEMKVLIVLDDVDDDRILNQLAGSHTWFGEGSRIIITTRDMHVLTTPMVYETYSMRLLHDDDAMKVFCKHAPRGNNRIDDYEQLSKEVVSYARGLPLALEVIGCLLRARKFDEWRSALDRLKAIHDGAGSILEVLKVSYDGLEKVEQRLFLEIACFYRGGHKTEDTMMMFDACGFHPVIGIRVLVEKALITVTDNRMFDMHDLIQEMAYYIVRGEAETPDKYSRVWKKKDVGAIFSMDTTTNLDMIEAIDIGNYFGSGKQLHILQVVARMKNLRWIFLTDRYRKDPDLVMPETFPPQKL